MKNQEIFGLSKTTIDRLLNVFNKFDVVQQVILFGSRAKGNFKEGSDIDLALIGDGLNFETIRKLEIKIDDLMLPYDVDLIIYDKIKETKLKEHIKRMGVELM
ncbi:nucleotidyltransferase family protein [Marinilabilia rubra]|uniref:nucleotidyltransferase family protein n=1 Tax=Marinilabilia rubra TaxID=2162893 RepID=UPI0018E0A59F|nr:nucleotidyltransferase domain-containing protein [Marinilabilia rubra]